MRIFTDISAADISGPTVATIGNFDGLHRGHQALLDRVLQEAHDFPVASAHAAIVTFSPHPLSVLRPEIPHKLLTTPEERLALAAAQGIDIGVIQPFTMATAGLDARAFMELLRGHLGLVKLVVGPDFALGRNRSGDLQTLRVLGEEMGYTLSVMEPIQWQGKGVRSSIIRRLLQEGSVAEAAELLGRPYHVSGLVVEGDRRGRTIGIPTANVNTPPERLLPGDGVYATRTTVHTPSGDATTYNSVTNLGVRPTVDGLHHRLETHLLDFPADGQSTNLYGQRLSVAFVAHLRGEMRFSGLDELVAQIRADIAQAQARFATTVQTRTTSGRDVSL